MSFLKKIKANTNANVGENFLNFMETFIGEGWTSKEFVQSVLQAWQKKTSSKSAKQMAEIYFVHEIPPLISLLTESNNQIKNILKDIEK